MKIIDEDKLNGILKSSLFNQKKKKKIDRLNHSIIHLFDLNVSCV